MDIKTAKSVLENIPYTPYIEITPEQIEAIAVAAVELDKIIARQEKSKLKCRDCYYLNSRSVGRKYAMVGYCDKKFCRRLGSSVACRYFEEMTFNQKCQYERLNG